MKLAALLHREKFIGQVLAQADPLPPGQRQALERPENEGPEIDDGMKGIVMHVRLLKKMGYEFTGHEETIGGQKFASAFRGPEGDAVLLKHDGSWVRDHTGLEDGFSVSQRGKNFQDLQYRLVKDVGTADDDKNHHATLKSAGFQLVNRDEEGNKYYKNMKSGRTIVVDKSGKWLSRPGSGTGAKSLREALAKEYQTGREQELQDGMRQMKMKRKQQEMGKQRFAGRY